MTIFSRAKLNEKNVLVLTFPRAVLVMSKFRVSFMTNPHPKCKEIPIAMPVFQIHCEKIMIR